MPFRPGELPSPDPLCGDDACPRSSNAQSYAFRNTPRNASGGRYLRATCRQALQVWALRTRTTTGEHCTRAGIGTTTPQLEQFVTPDPIGYEGSEWGLYEYVQSGPAAAIDLTVDVLAGSTGPPFYRPPRASQPSTATAFSSAVAPGDRASYNESSWL